VETTLWLTDLPGGVTISTIGPYVSIRDSRDRGVTVTISNPTEERFLQNTAPPARTGDRFPGSLRRAAVIGVVGAGGGGLGYVVSYALGACSTCATGASPLTFAFVMAAVASWSAYSGTT
jgi:hypothetical protein